MSNEQEDAAYYLRKAEEFRQKAKAANDSRLKAALEAVAREYLAMARELDPSNREN